MISKARLQIKFVFAIILFFSFQNLTAQRGLPEQATDHIFVKGGKVIRGTITDMTDKEGLTIRTLQGVELIFPYRRIRKIVRKPALINMMNASYPELGICYGTPGFLNFAAGFWTEKVGFRLSGMKFGRELSAFQLHTGFKISDTNRQRHSLGISFGRYGVGDRDFRDHFNYIGPAYNYTGPPFSIKSLTNAWFVEIGYAFAFGEEVDGDGVNGFPLLQIGYMFRFLPQAPRNEIIPVPEFPKPPPCPDCPECPECPDCPEITQVVAKGNTENEPPPDFSDRTIESPKTVEIAQPEIIVTIWDNGYPDDDVIALELNGKLILNNHVVKKERFSFAIQLEAGKENILILHAVSTGRTSPNTTAMMIKDGYQKKTVVLDTDMKKSNSLRLVIQK